MTEITKEEFAIYEEISRLGESLWDASRKVVALNRDPKIFSVMLFKRLWSNHRGYTLLYNHGFSLESDIILRAGLEAAICIAANYHLRDEFVVLMRGDTAFTLKGQIKVHRDGDATSLVQGNEAMVRMLQEGLPEGTKSAKLDWKKLAEQGQVPKLYNYHRTLSGITAHVTGISLLRNVVDADGSGAGAHDEFNKIEKSRNLMMMAGATLQGSMLHAAMIDDEGHIQVAKSLRDQLNVISKGWP